MKNLTSVLFGVLTLVASSQATAATWQDKKVGMLQPLSAYSCYFFTLDGVSEADPARPGNPWFAIPVSQVGAKETYATLLAAKASGFLVVAATTGTLECGYAKVNYVYVKSP